MDSALLRIKFAPLIKKIHTDLDSKCYIEISPKLTAFKNLDKICCWKIDDNLTEYTVPMTYTVIIKKQNSNKKERQKKVYHSCVDLLSCDSRADLGSGDITRILSDIRPFRSLVRYEDDLEITNQITEKNDSTSQQNKTKDNSVSIQTPDVAKQKDFLIREEPLLNKNFGVNLIEKSSQTIQEVLTRENSSITEGIFKHDKAVDPMQVFEEDMLAEHESMNSLQVRLDDFSRKLSNYQIRFAPIYSNFARICCRSMSVDAVSEEEGVNNFLTDYQTTKTENSLLGRNPIILHATETKLKRTVADDIKQSYNSTRLKTIHFKNESDQTNPVARSCGNNTDNVDHYNIRLKLGTSLFDSKYYTNSYYPVGPALDSKKMYITRSDVQPKVVLKERRAYMQEQIKTENNTETGSIQKFLCENSFKGRNNVQKPRKIRPTPETRVKDILEEIANELNPLNIKLDEIKSKCLMLGLGLFCGEFIAKHNSIICKSFADDVSNNYEKTPKEIKSNRVVYTFVFKG